MKFQSIVHLLLRGCLLFVKSNHQAWQICFTTTELHSFKWKASHKNVVFDVYEDNSIKDLDRIRRSCDELNLCQIIPEAEIKQWGLLLSSNDNKNKLVEFIRNQ